MTNVVIARTPDKLKDLLIRVVSESIDAAINLDDPGEAERLYQQSMAQGISSAGKTARSKTSSAKPADTKAPAKQVEPNEAEEDDIFAGTGGDKKPKADKSEKPAEKPAAPATAPVGGEEEKRQNRNSPEAAKFSLADAQQRAHEKEKTAASVVPTPKPEDLSFDMIVTAFNIMRSGQSLKDERVKGEVERYFNSLKGAERVALYSYLNGLAQIVAANVPSTQAPSPDDVPNPVSMEFAQGAPAGDGKKTGDAGDKKQVSKKSQAEKKPEKSEPEDDLEDTSPPITVGPREGKMHKRPIV